VQKWKIDIPESKKEDAVVIPLIQAKKEAIIEPSLPQKIIVNSTEPIVQIQQQKENVIEVQKWKIDIPEPPKLSNESQKNLEKQPTIKDVSVPIQKQNTTPMISNQDISQDTLKWNIRWWKQEMTPNEKNLKNKD
jgi:hypothetical protein